MEMFMEQLFQCQSAEDVHYYYSNYISSMENDVEYNKQAFSQELQELLEGLNDLYYNQGDSPLSDECYDMLCACIYDDFEEIKAHSWKKLLDMKSVVIPV